MLWVVQQDLFIENRRHDLVSTLDRFSIPYHLVRITADNQIDPEIDHNGAIITNGSIMLSKIAVQRGWQPGSLLNDNFSYEHWYPIFKEHLLNRDAKFTTIAEASFSLDRMFVRPILDDKTFSGKVFGRNEFETMRSESLAGLSRSIKPDTQIMVSSVKNVGQEHRHYIVGGKVVTSSRYKLGGAVNHAEGADPAIVDFAERMAARWSPARAFVLDTYMTNDEIGIVEMGCICNAGLYQADIQKLVAALDAL